MTSLTRAPRGVALACAALASVAAFAGCGSDKGSASGTSDPSSNPAAAAGLAAAKAQVADVSAAPTSPGIDKPIDKTKVTGKTVVYLECSIVNCKIHADALADAFKPLGIKLKTVDSGLSPESFKNALTTAASLHPDGLISDAIPASISQGPIDAMAADGVSVVSIVAPDLKLGKNVANVMGAPYMDRQGSTLANWTIADSGGSANALYLNDTTLSFSPFAAKGLNTAFSKNCPGCKVDTLGTNSGEISTALPNKISSYLQAHPDVKYLVGEYCALFTGVPGALATAGIKGIKTVCASPTQIDQQSMQAGQETAGIFNSNAAMSWYAADTVARLMSGDQPLPVVDNPPNMQLMGADGVTWDPAKADYTWISGWEQMFVDGWEGKS
jgi:hypothetical protein